MRLGEYFKDYWDYGKDKVELINNEKSIISSLTLDDILREIITQKCIISSLTLDDNLREIITQKSIISSLTLHDNLREIITQKSIISSLTLDDNLREIITQKNNKLKLMKNEIEKLRYIKTNDADLRIMEQKLQNSEGKLRGVKYSAKMKH